MAKCRRILSLDRWFLKGMYEGQLLIDVGIGANDCIYLIAWDVENKENHDNWTWFLGLLVVDMEINNSHHWVFMSDRQKVRNLVVS